jgi:hypothetical protein
MHARSARPLVGLGVALVAALGVLLVPATSAQAADTTVTFAITSAGLTITGPASTDLGSGTSGSNLTASLGTVTVSDARGLLTASWTATVTSTDFTTGGGTPAETIPKADVSYWSGPATGTTGIGVFTPGQLTGLLAQPLSAARTAYTLTLGVGNNSATWNPNLIISLPSSAVAGVYTGTVTNSVA